MSEKPESTPAGNASGKEKLHRRIGRSVRTHARTISAVPKKSLQRMAKPIRKTPEVVVSAMERFGKQARTAWNAPWARRTRHIVWAGTVVAVTLAVVLVGLFSFYSLNFDKKILVKIHVPGADLSGLTPDEALHLLEANYSVLTAGGIPFEVNGKDYTVPVASLGIKYDLKETVRRAFAIGHTGDFVPDQLARLSAIFVTEQIVSPAEIVSQEGVEKGVRSTIPEVSVRPIDADVVVDHHQFQIRPSAHGTTTDFADVTRQIVAALESFEPHGIRITVQDAAPAITDDEAGRAVQFAEDLVTHKLALQYDNHGVLREWAIDLSADKNWIGFTADGPVLRASVNEAKLRAFLDSTVAKVINREATNATIVMPEEGKKFATLTGRAEDGYAVLADDTALRVKRDIENGVFTSPVAVAFEPGKVLLPDGRDVGLHDLLSVGRSNFANSPAGRAFNIGFGLSKYNGLLIAPGEMFSFNQWLGQVDEVHGWKDALAIFNGGDNTEPVAGGGLCQVATTMYRAAVRAGLPIVARTPHSFFVSYYTVGGEGLDATIYPPNPDLKFVNDTGSMILIQSYTDGSDAYVKFYGTSDGRTVTLDGPNKSAWIPAGEARVVETTDLLPGTEKQDMPAHPGRRITWKQTVEYTDGRKVENAIVSVYRAVPALIKRGVTVLTQTPEQSTDAAGQVIL